MQPATGQAAWQIEQAKAPKQRSGSITAIVLGTFLRGPLIIFVHMMVKLYIYPLHIDTLRSLAASSEGAATGSRQVSERHRQERDVQELFELVESLAGAR